MPHCRDRMDFAKSAASTTVAAPSSCPACEASAFRWFGNKNGHDLYQCAICRSVTCGAVAGDRVIGQMYEGRYANAAFHIPSSVRMSLTRLLQSLGQFRATGNLLDIGYGEGALLLLAREQGWNCFGTEISRPALCYGEEQGWNVSSDINSPAFPVGEFDAITMIELLEHLRQPREMLETVYRCLRPGGVLYLTTPNARSLNGRVLGKQWSVFAPPEHLTVWSARGLCRILRETNFHIRSLRVEGLNPAELANRRASADPSATARRNSSAASLNDAFNQSPSRRAMKRAANQLLTWTRTGDRLKVLACRGA